MWLMMGLFGGILGILSGLVPLGVAGIAIGVICQIAERKDDEVWEKVQDTPVANVYPILSVAAALIVALVCFAFLSLGLSMTMQTR
jgi:hypothetical protein